jgi:hypothetical protein
VGPQHIKRLRTNRTGRTQNGNVFFHRRELKHKERKFYGNGLV